MALLQMKLYAPSLKSRTNVNILLPTPQPSIDPGMSVTSTDIGATEGFIGRLGKDIPVLYLLHGSFGDEGDWQRFSRIEDYARNYRVIVVMPAAENSSYRDLPSGRNYATWITRELPAMIEWMFPAAKTREGRFIAGLSMGGKGAFKLGLTNADRYSRVASFSGGRFDEISDQAHFEKKTVWSYGYEEGEPIRGTAEDAYWLAKHVVDAEKAGGGPKPELYLSCGTEDFLYESNSRLHEYLDEIGYAHTYDAQPGIHNWDFWDPQIQKVLEWLPIRKLSEIRDL